MRARGAHDSGVPPWGVWVAVGWWWWWVCGVGGFYSSARRRSVGVTVMSAYGSSCWTSM